VLAPRQIGELRAALASKEEKLRGLRTAIVRLKEEFVKAEEEHARAKELRDHDRDGRAMQVRAEADEQVRTHAAPWEPCCGGLGLRWCLVSSPRCTKYPWGGMWGMRWTLNASWKG
jgi:hypothetical protein